MKIHSWIVFSHIVLPLPFQLYYICIDIHIYVYIYIYIYNILIVAGSSDRVPSLNANGSNGSHVANTEAVSNAGGIGTLGGVMFELDTWMHLDRNSNTQRLTQTLNEWSIYLHLLGFYMFL